MSDMCTCCRYNEMFKKKKKREEGREGKGKEGREGAGNGGMDKREEMKMRVYY